METGNLKHSYRNQFDNACFVHDAAYSDSKDLPKKTISVKIFKDRAHEIARSHGYNGYQRALASMFYMFFDNKTGSVTSVNKQLAQELHEPVMKTFNRSKVHTRFKDNIYLKWYYYLQRM